MTISYNWLRQYLPIDLDVQQAAALLTAGGLEVEHVEPFCPIPGGLEGLVIGQVLSCTKHPDADRLSITTVDVGGAEALPIVCGAPNVAAGQKVVVATVGTMVHPTTGEPFEIKKAKIRGQVSEGMICAEDEIGLGTSHDGILVLPTDAKVGMAAADHFKIGNDYILDIGLTPNRSDAMSHLGVARDLRALVHSHHPEMALPKLQWPEVETFTPTLGPSVVSIDVLAADAAPRYVGIHLKGITVQPSPQWLKDALQSIGLRPINNVVDVTNYVLHSLGQPLHAFDADKIGGGRVVVRKANLGEEFTTLDGTLRKLNPDDLMICDAASPMCLAGVFGGLSSGVSDATTNIFLESAYFNPTSVRKTAKRHGLSTDASFRFERGVDPETVVYASKWAALLLQQVAGGEYSQITDSYPQPVPYHKVAMGLSRLDAMVGQHIPVATVKEILADLGIYIEKEKDGVLHLSVPTFKFDVTREADVIEEVLRIYGYDRIQGAERISIPITASTSDKRPALRDVLSDRLAAMGFNEMMANSLIPSSYNQTLFPDQVGADVGILNPLSSDLAVLRQDLVFGGLDAVARNIRHQRADLRLFEFGTVYRSSTDAAWPYHEEEYLSIIMCGRAWPERWNAPAGQVGHEHLKGTVDALLARFDLKFTTAPITETDGAICQGLVYTAKGEELLRLGLIGNKVLKHFGIETPVYQASIRFTRLCKLLGNGRPRVTDLPKFPYVTRDLALIIDRTVQFADLEKAAIRTGGKLLQSVDLFDVYEGKGIPEGKRSYAMRFVLQDAETTLTDKRIDDTMGRIVSTLTKDHGAELRG